jgi:uncharacterized membrane protein YhiD involved in acid resistance
MLATLTDGLAAAIGILLQTALSIGVAILGIAVVIGAVSLYKRVSALIPPSEKKMAQAVRHERLKKQYERIQTDKASKQAAESAHRESIRAARAHFGRA